MGLTYTDMPSDAAQGDLDQFDQLDHLGWTGSKRNCHLNLPFFRQEGTRDCKDQSTSDQPKAAKKRNLSLRQNLQTGKCLPWKIATRSREDRGKNLVLVVAAMTDFCFESKGEDEVVLLFHKRLLRLLLLSKTDEEKYKNRQGARRNLRKIKAR